MRRAFLGVTAIVVAFAVAYVISGRQASVLGQARPGAGFAGVPGEKGGQDLTGPY